MSDGITVGALVTKAAAIAVGRKLHHRVMVSGRDRNMAAVSAVIVRAIGGRQQLQVEASSELDHASVLLTARDSGPRPDTRGP